VAIVGVDWAPETIDGVEFDRGGHWFNAQVTEDGLKWADAQDATYQDWPPSYVDDVKTVESVYRRPDEDDWRT
jgi:hypothetical protein